MDLTRAQTEQWIEDALKDGAILGFVYQNEEARGLPPTDPSVYGLKLTFPTPEGEFLAHVYRNWATSLESRYRRDDARISIWGPDELQIKVPETYRPLGKADLDTCAYCHRTGTKTARVSFAGRCCQDCLSEQRKELEYPGWYN